VTQPAIWYFDVISPYAYLHLKQFPRLPADLAIEYRPVLFAGLLKHWGTKGPAELPAKRVHTYRQAVWFAHELGVPFRMPPRHPFNPLKVLRLIIGLGASRAVVETAWRGARVAVALSESTLRSWGLNASPDSTERTISAGDRGLPAIRRVPNGEGLLEGRMGLKARDMESNVARAWWAPLRTSSCLSSSRDWLGIWAG
jgi:hypothetical protein